MGQRWVEEPSLGLYHKQVTIKNKDYKKYLISGLTASFLFIGILLVIRNMYPAETNIDRPAACDTETVVSVHLNGIKMWYICYSDTIVQNVLGVEKVGSSEETVGCMIDNKQIESPSVLGINYIDLNNKRHSDVIARPMHVCTWAWLKHQGHVSFRSGL